MKNTRRNGLPSRAWVDLLLLLLLSLEWNIHARSRRKTKNNVEMMIYYSFTFEQWYTWNHHRWETKIGEEEEHTRKTCYNNSAVDSTRNMRWDSELGTLFKCGMRQYWALSCRNEIITFICLCNIQALSRVSIGNFPTSVISEAAFNQKKSDANISPKIHCCFKPNDSQKWSFHKWWNFECFVRFSFPFVCSA